MEIKYNKAKEFSEASIDDKMIRTIHFCYII
jgi:hypothetical protein